MKLLRRLVLALLFLALIGGLALGLLAWRAGEWLRGAAEDALQARLLPQVTLAEPVEWQVWPLGQVRLRGLVLRGPDGTPLAAVDEIAAGFAFGELLADRPRIATLDVRGLHLKVDIDGQGHPSPLDWLLPAAPQETVGAPPAPVIDRFTLADTEVLLDYPARDLRLRALLPQLAAGPVAMGEAGRLRLTARIELVEPLAGELAVEGETGYRFDAQGIRLDALTAGLSGQLDGAWRLDEGRLEIAAARIAAGEGFQLESADFAAQADGPQGPLKLSATIDQAGMAASRWQAAGRAALAAPRFEIDAGTAFHGEGDVLSGTLEGRLAGSALSGRWSWPLRADGVPDLQLAIDELDLDALRARLPSAETDGGTPRWEDWPLTAEVLVGRLRLGGMESRNARLSLQGPPAAR